MRFRAHLPLLITTVVGLAGAGVLWNAEFRPRAGERYLRDVDSGARTRLGAFFGVPAAKVLPASCMGEFDADDKGVRFFRPYAVAALTGERRVNATLRADRTGGRLGRLEPR